MEHITELMAEFGTISWEMGADLVGQLQMRVHVSQCNEGQPRQKYGANLCQHCDGLVREMTKVFLRIITGSQLLWWA